MLNSLHLYHIFAQDLHRFEKDLAPTIFKKFINVPGKVIYDGDKFLIKIRNNLDPVNLD